MITLEMIRDRLILEFTNQRNQQGFYVPLATTFSPTLKGYIKERKLSDDQLRRVMLLAIDKLPALEYPNETKY
jgi:hypothetical protein